MNNLKITDDLRISLCGTGYKFERRMILEKGKNAGKEKWVDDGYYGKSIRVLMSAALDKIVHMNLPSTLPELRVIIENAVNELKPIIKSIDLLE